jgi:methyl-accepting chemotaxis protein
MFEWIKLFPPYLVFFTLLFVILPAILSSLIRITLYKYLQDSGEKVKRLITGRSRGKQPAIVDKLEARFKQASSKLESVNTSALIDGIYSEEEFSFLSKLLRCEQWDYFTRILPNLLLAFGLLGTFLGITLNLTNISEIIHQGNADNSSLVQNLQVPLQSMGIAFITSLIALLCSSVLTVINLRFNTNLARTWLISSLEDYLDNIFHPTIDGHTRLDKAVNRMVEQQNEFLTRFHDNVTKAVESSLGRVAQQIAEGNIEAASLAKQVYERLTETSGTLARGSETFLSSTLLLEKHINSLNEIVQHKNFVEYAQTLNFAVQAFLRASEKIEESQFANKLASATADLVISHNQFAESTSVLNQSTQSIESVIQDFQKSIQWMVDLGEKISLVNQQSAELLSANQNQIVFEEESFKKILTELVELVETVKISQEQANSEVRTLGNSLVSNISNLLGSNSDNLQRVSQTIEQSASHLKETQSGLSQILATVNNNSKGLNNSLQYVQDISQILKKLTKQMENS